MPDRKKPKKSPASPLLKGLYIAAVIVSALIVLTYLRFKAFIKPPPMAEPPSLCLYKWRVPVRSEKTKR